MSDKQAGWVVVPKRATAKMHEAIRDVMRDKHLSDATIAWEAGVAASPSYEPRDAVEVACAAYDDNGEGLQGMRAALTAAYPELLARIEALESEVLHWKQLYADHDCEQLQAEVDRLRKGVV